MTISINNGGTSTPATAAQLAQFRADIGDLHYASIAALNAAIALDVTTPLIVDGHPMTVAGEAPGVVRRYDATAKNALRVTVMGLPLFSLAGNLNTVTAVATPGTAPTTGGSQGDVQVDYLLFCTYTKGASVWSAPVPFLGPVGGPPRTIAADGLVLASDNGKTLINPGGSNFTLTLSAGLPAGFGVALMQLSSGTLTVAQGTATLNTSVGGAATTGVLLPLCVQQTGTDTYATVGAAAGNAAGYVAGAATASIAYEMAGSAIDVTKELNTKTGIVADFTVTGYSATPAVPNTWLLTKITSAAGAALAVNLPATPPTFSTRQQANVSSLVLPAGGTLILSQLWDGTRYILDNDPTIPSAALVAYTGSFAGRPTGLTAGTYYEAVFTSGFGQSTRYLKHYTIDGGTTWRPVGGSAIVAQIAGTIAAPLASLTGVSGSFTLPAGFSIPAGYLAANAKVFVDALVRKTSASTGAAFTFNMRFGTAGSTSDPAIFGAVVGAAGTLQDYWASAEFDLTSATTFFIRNTQGPNAAANSSGAFVDRSGSINTAAAMSLSADIASGNASDTYNILNLALRVQQ